MKTIFRIAFITFTLGFLSLAAHSQIRQTHLYIDDGHGNFSILSAPVGGGVLTLPGSTLIFPSTNAAGVLRNNGLGTLSWVSSLTNPMSATGDLIYSSDNSGTPANLAIGTSGEVLTVSSGGLPSWSPPTGTILIATNSGSNLANNNFLEQGGSQTAFESQAQIVATRTGTLKNLFVSLTAPPGGVSSRTFTVRINGVSTLLLVPISGASTTGSNTTTPIAINPFDLISIINTTSGGAANSIGMASFELAY